ncbi:SMP-30/gluconolactonase/LRE family protein [Facilibium subflavum]|uniref:SMP-30/gluconolactonase/LRE family protein n=1 Tax=Facilibium subflavum TaxID=2219058 RepID=UPI000E6506D8|nr:gluconolactonase [Facilibium subflavum]
MTIEIERKPLYTPLPQNTPRNLVHAEVIASFPVNTFLENLAIDHVNNIYITDTKGFIYKVDPSGDIETFAHVNGEALGICFGPQGEILVSGCDDNNIATIFHINTEGIVNETFKLQEASYFLNGMIAHRYKEHHYLVADSIKGCIWQYDYKNKSAELWLKSQLLKSPIKEGSLIVGANGLKFHERQLYITNTQGHCIIKVEIELNGQAGEASVYVDGILGDDLDIDSSGNLYVCTHIFNSIVRVSRDRRFSIIAEDLEGVTGCTAALFGEKEKKNTLYVVTNGGMVSPPVGGIREAKLVALDLNQFI